MAVADSTWVIVVDGDGLGDGVIRGGVWYPIARRAGATEFAAINGEDVFGGGRIDEEVMAEPTTARATILVVDQGA